jgi:hypothetical protein
MILTVLQLNIGYIIIGCLKINIARVVVAMKQDLFKINPDFIGFFYIFFSYTI